MTCVNENLGFPDAVDANVCPKSTLVAVTPAAKPQNARVGTSHLPLSGDWQLRGGCQTSQTVVFIQVSVSSSGLGSYQC